MAISRYEMETSITYNEEDGQAAIYTASNRMIKQLDTLCEQHPDTYSCRSRNEYSAAYVCPKNRIKFAKPASKKQVEANRIKGISHGFKTGQLAVTENANQA